MTCIGLDAATGEAVRVDFDGTIRLVEQLVEPVETSTWLSPGWIDLQVNGFAGADYNSGSTSHEEIARSIRTMFATGVTRFYPTLITGGREEMLAALRNLARAKAALKPEGAAMEAFHCEGPHISPEDGPRGAHPRQHVREPDVEEFERWQEAAEGNIRLVTLAPEWPGAPAYIEHLVRQGVVVSIGHTKANGSQIAAAVSAGATMSTHLGNGAHLVLERHPNYIWEQLAEDRLAASFIVDGIHLPKSFLKAALRAKGLDRSVLVTDAVMPAGCQPGPYRIGDVDVVLHPDDRVTLAGETRLAGSSLRMDRGIENLMKLAGLSLAESLSLAHRNPARVGRIAMRQRGLNPGEWADLVEFRLVRDTHSIEVLKTYLAGEVVFSKQ